MLELTADELPVLGEGLPVDLANTRYGAEGEAIDFLETSALIALWLEAVGEDAPADLEPDALRALRDAVHRVFGAVVAGTVPSAADVARLNADAARGAPQRVMVWEAGATAPRLVVQRRSEDGAGAALLGRLAEESVALLCGPAREALRICAAPDCAMFYVRDHHRRRFCHPSCSHRTRQAAYYRRQRRGRA